MGLPHLLSIEPWELRTAANSPWFSPRELAAVNWPETVQGKERLAAVRDFFSLTPLLDAADRLLAREPVLARRWTDPAAPFEIAAGGWLPNGAAFAGSPTVRDLVYRQQCRAAGRFEEADLVRDVVEGGSVAVHDMTDGTLWFYGQ